jgi:hypothetical protein
MEIAGHGEEKPSILEKKRLAGEVGTHICTPKRICERMNSPIKFLSIKMIQGNGLGCPGRASSWLSYSFPSEMLTFQLFLYSSMLGDLMMRLSLLLITVHSFELNHHYFTSKFSHGFILHNVLLSGRYSKEEEIPIEEFEKRNFTYLLK